MMKLTGRNLVNWLIIVIQANAIGFAVMAGLGGIGAVPAAAICFLVTASSYLGEARAKHNRAIRESQARDRWKGRWGPPE